MMLSLDLGLEHRITIPGRLMTWCTSNITPDLKQCTQADKQSHFTLADESACQKLPIITGHARGKKAETLKMIYQVTAFDIVTRAS